MTVPVHRKSKTGLIAGIVVGVLLLIGGGVTALVVTLNDEDDGGGSSASPLAPAAAGKPGPADSGKPGPAADLDATVHSFVEAYNSAVTASDPAAFPVDDYVCSANHDDVTRPLEDGSGQVHGLRLKVVWVTDRGNDTASVTVAAFVDGSDNRLTVEFTRADGRWKLCDPRLGALIH